MSCIIIIAVIFFLSIISGFVAHGIIRNYIPIYVNLRCGNRCRRLTGYDQCKKEKPPIPEPFGVIVAAIYLISIFIFIPVLFSEWNKTQTESNSSYLNLISLLAGLVSICTAILLGFADDILDLRWRHKLIFPTLSSLPLLIVYFLSGKSTSMHLPFFVQKSFGATYIDFGALYYIFIVMLVIFCTNAINIIAGINGVEVGQSLVIAFSVAVYSFVQIFRLDSSHLWDNVLSLCFVLPFISTSLALFDFNKYPAKVFVGDTYCYWAGMTLAVCAITGHFSKTLLLFLIPQILNFLYSCPQLFGMIPCPRHRLPKFNPDNGLLHMSMAEWKHGSLPASGELCLKLLRAFHLVHYREFEKIVEEEKEKIRIEKWVEINNLTILNFLLGILGPREEWRLTNNFMAVQFGCSIGAFLIRFYLPRMFYDHVL